MVEETILAGHYQVVRPLGRGGFGQTFLAKDTDSPANPLCVIKQLKPRATDLATLTTAKRLFDREVQTLARLGSHDRIPSLLDHFEQDEEFYLVQEFIDGQPLDQEIADNNQWTESGVRALLQDILQVLVFVHQQNVIHRDIKPANLIRRSKDNRIVLIDFGAVKEVSNPTAHTQANVSLTVAVGSRGYMPNEQLAGNPRFSSDIYAVGMLGIQALTGVHPRNLSTDLRTSEIYWRDYARHVSSELTAILDKMVRYDFRDRYPTAVEALEALQISTERKESLPLTEPWPEETSLLSKPHLQPPTTNSSRSIEPSRRSQRHQNLPRSVPTTNPLPLTQVQSRKPWLIPAGFAAMGVGMMILLVSKTFLFPQVTSQNASRNAVPELSTNKPAASSPNNSNRSAAQTTSAPGSSPEKIASAPASSPTKATPTPSSSTASSTPDLDPSVTELLRQADRLRETGQYEKAIAAYNQALSRKSDIAEAQWGRCYSLNKLQRATEAIASCEQALALKPNYPEALWSEGYALDQQQRHQEALKRFDRAIALKPDFAEAWSNQGAVLQKLNRPTEAIAAFDKATALKPNYVQAWTNRGTALWRLGRYEEAIASLDKALQIQPDNKNALNLRQQVQKKLGR